MTLRIAAALGLVLGVAGLMGFLHLLGIGPFASREYRHMRAMKDRRDAPAHVEPMRLSMFDSLPNLPPLDEYAVLERRGVVVEGYIKHMMRAPDDDFHLEVTDRPPTGAPTAHVTAEVTPYWRGASPEWSFERLRETFRTGSGGEATRFREPARRVRLTGWLMYDFQFEPRQPDLTRVPRAQRVSGWEVHPVTRIEVWDDERAAFVEVPR